MYMAMGVGVYWGATTIGNMIFTNTVGRVYKYYFPPEKTNEERLLELDLARENIILEKLKKLEEKIDVRFGNKK